MSKLEDKLAASIKPGKAAAAPERRPRPATRKPAKPPAEAMAVPAPAPEPVPNAPARPLHPRRVWPD
jgi:hypothetical protein